MPARTLDELRDNNLERLKAHLSDGQWHSRLELTDLISTRFGASVQTAREQGFGIEIEMKDGDFSDWKYRYNPAWQPDLKYPCMCCGDRMSEEKVHRGRLPTLWCGQCVTQIKVARQFVEKRCPICGSYDIGVLSYEESKRRLLRPPGVAP